MRRIFFVFLLLFVFSFGCRSNEPAFSREAQGRPQYLAQATEEQPQASSAKMAPDFTLYDIYQNPYVLSSYKDKQPVLLLFWATWCPFCRKELKVLNGMYSSLAADEIEVLSINVGEEPGTVEDFVKNYNLVYRVLLDRDNRVAGLYGLIGIPTYVLINKKGEIVFKDNYAPTLEYKDLLGIK